MAYILKSGSGRIVKADTAYFEGASFLPDDDPEIINFLVENGVDPRAVQAALFHLRVTDSDMMRVVEDLYTTLVALGAIEEDDLPTRTRMKIVQRQSLRKHMQQKYVPFSVPLMRGQERSARRL